MEKKNSSGGGKKESGNGGDLTDIRLRKFFCEFLAWEQQRNPKLFSFLKMEDSEILESIKRKLRREEGTSMEGTSSGDNVGDEQEQPHESHGLPREVKEKIQESNGCEVKFVTQKKLSKTDVNRSNGRLSIPPSKIVNNFLTQAEESSLDKRFGENQRLAGMPVFVLDPSLTEYNMCLKKWSMERSYVYNLTKGWNQIVRDNDLKPNDTLQLWSFRVSSQLRFALVKL
ncbi:B3 domain-containing protein [Spatholobus suberectus]|nr:B3 domain-containing protein [Spatholobus suberectus]